MRVYWRGALEKVPRYNFLICRNSIIMKLRENGKKAKFYLKSRENSLKFVETLVTIHSIHATFIDSHIVLYTNLF